MTVTVAGQSQSFTNGTANDATPVMSEFTALFTNTTNLADKVDKLLSGKIEDGTSLILNQTFTGSPSSNCDFEVERGSSANTRIRWNETNDWWELTEDGTNYKTISHYTTMTLQVFTTTGTGQTWTKPTGCKKIRVEVIGAGGGGGGSSNTADRTGGGGASGAYATKLIDVSSIASGAYVDVGAGGTAGALNTDNAGTGGTSKWADGTNTVQSTGGTGGKIGSGTNSPVAGGTATGGSYNINGAYGGRGGNDGKAFNTGRGGDSPMGFGAGGVPDADVAGIAGVGYGSGGAGGNTADTSGNAGAVGNQGIVLVWEYYQ